MVDEIKALNRKRVLVIPGVEPQLSLVNKLHENNYEVVCINPDPNCEVFQVADYCEQRDILDVEFCEQIARKYNVVAIMSDECDIAMPVVAGVSDILGLPSIGEEMARLYTDKHLMRNFLRDNYLPCPQYRVCETIDSAKSFYNGLQKGKMIIKPMDSNSSRGVYTVTSEDEIETLFNSTKSYSRIKKAVLCEEYIEGPEFTVDGVVVDSTHYTLAISRKKHYEHHHNIACELFFSWEDREVDYSLLRTQNDNYVKKTGLRLGFTHAEYKFCNGKFYMIEIGARGGGNFISSHIVPIMSGIDNYQCLIESTVTGNLEKCRVILEKLDNNIQKCAVLKFLDIPKECDGKKITGICGKRNFENSYIVKHYLKYKIGDVARVPQNDSERVGYYIAYGDSRDELLGIMNRIEKEVKYEFD